MNTFIAFDIPTPAKAVLTASLEAYRGKLATTMPENKWHITMLFLGDTKLSPDSLLQLQQPLRTAYLPTITVLSLGAGKQVGQLWAHIHATPALIEMRNIIINQLSQCGIAIPQKELAREFVPHITLGTTVTSNKHIGITDTPAKVTFAVQEAIVLRSVSDEPNTPYERIATILLVP